MSTHNIPFFNMTKKNNLNYPKSAAIRIFFQGTQERVRKSRGKRATSVRAIEVLLYMKNYPLAEWYNSTTTTNSLWH